jgi:hypothetical protein
MAFNLFATCLSSLTFLDGMLYLTKRKATALLLPVAALCVPGVAVLLR